MMRHALAMLGLAVAACERAPAPAPIVRHDPTPTPAVTIVRDPPPAPRDDKLADIREAALRHMFGNNAAGQKHPDVLCIRLEDDADPAPTFLARFHDLAVRPGSACLASASTGVEEIATHKNGLLFHIDRIEWPNTVTAAVSIGYYEGGLSASGNIYWLQRINGHWLVVAERMDWIS